MKAPAGIARIARIAKIAGIETQLQFLRYAKAW